MSFELPLLPQIISTHIEKWASRRLPEPDYKATIIHKRLYILPTRHGILFFAILVLILTGAINYENSLAFMLTFLLTSICFLSMIHCHQNINNLTITSSPAKPVFSGQSALFPISIKTDRKQSCFSICLESEDNNTSRFNLLNEQDQTSILVPLEASKRGYLSLGKIKISTEFPLGLFHAWSWVDLKAQCLVYPKPKSHLMYTTNTDHSSGANAHQQAGYDDFFNIREYQKEDPPNHLAWKSIAKTGILQTKEFHGNSNDEIYFNWFDLPYNLSTENRLSIICYWIIEAEKKGMRYGLNLPDFKIEPNSGMHHQQICLKRLALF